MTWAVVLYPAWDDWPETQAGVRDAIQAWLGSWVIGGPPPDSDEVDRLIEVVGVGVRYFTTVHPSTGVTVTYIIGRAGGRDYVAVVEIRSPRRRRSSPLR